MQARDWAVDAEAHAAAESVERLTRWISAAAIVADDPARARKPLKLLAAGLNAQAIGLYRPTAEGVAAVVVHARPSALPALSAAAASALRNRRPLEISAPEGQSLGRLLAVPVMEHGRPQAALVAGRAGEAPFSPSEIGELEAAAPALGLAAETVALREGAERNRRARTDSMNMASHDLRTPLTVISGYVRMFLDGALGPAPDTWRDGLERVALKAAELNDTIDTMLAGSAGDREIGAEAVDVVEAAAEAIRTVRGAGLIEGTRVQADASPVWVVGDAAAVTAIIRDLLVVAGRQASRRNVAVSVSDPGDGWVDVNVTAADSLGDPLSQRLASDLETARALANAQGGKVDLLPGRGAGPPVLRLELRPLDGPLRRRT